VRISEKTVEINYCAQFDLGERRPAFWFGLTQEQEKRAGYDVFSTSPGRLLVLQFKASSHVLRSGERRFRAPHHQLVALRDRLRGSRDIYYVLPEFGQSADLVGMNWDIIRHCWLLGLADIPPIEAPVRRDGALRKRGIHYFDLDATTGLVTIRSDPVVTRATKATEYSLALRNEVRRESQEALEESRERLQFESYEDFSRWTKAIGSRGVACFVAD
jgi:hypothetical protein